MPLLSASRKRSATDSPPEQGTADTRISHSLPPAVIVNRPSEGGGFHSVEVGDQFYSVCQGFTASPSSERR